MSLRLPDDLERKLRQEASLSGQPLSQLIREAVEALLSRRERGACRGSHRGRLQWRGRGAGRALVAVMHRGEIWVARLDPDQGAEVGKVRPVVVIQADPVTEAGLATLLVVPLTISAERRWLPWNWRCGA